MPKRFLQSEYQKLTKAELIKAIYKLADNADSIHGKWMNAALKVRKLQAANKRLRKRLSK